MGDHSQIVTAAGLGYVTGPVVVLNWYKTGGRSESN